ncbi:MAG: SGNH/GDSL hydrolase family protein [Candidatus Omnitrophota bacterium]
MKYAKSYNEFIKKNHGEDSLIVKDILHRKFYVPNLNISSGLGMNIQTNSFGMKERDINIQKEQGTYRIICLGSSYTLSGSTGNRFTDLLEKKLNNRYKHIKFEIINAGVSGQNILGSFMNFALDWRVLNPDMVIIDNVLDNVDSYNVPFYLSNYRKLFKFDTIAEYYTLQKIKNHIAFWRVLDLMVLRLRNTYNKIMFEENPSGNYSKQNPGSQELVYKEGLSYYERVLESLVLLAKGSNCKVVLLSCGITVDEKNNRESGNKFREWLEMHYSPMRADTIIYLIKEYNNIMEKISNRNNVGFIDLSQVVPKDHINFSDATHRSDSGNNIFSNVLMNGLIKYLPLDGAYANYYEKNSY